MKLVVAGKQRVNYENVGIDTCIKKQKPIRGIIVQTTIIIGMSVLVLLVENDGEKINELFEWKESIFEWPNFESP